MRHSGRFVGGPAVEAFEADWAAYCGTRYCVGLASGTAALHLTLAALGIGNGSEVIVPANGFIATAAAVVAAGAKPVFADVDPRTLLLTPQTMHGALTPRTAAVIVVHLFGQPADMDGINRRADRAGICVIEDAAQAHGASWHGRRAGSLSRAGCFSFYPGKNLGAFGDAGAVVTNDAALAGRVRAMSNHGRCNGNPYRHEMLGGNHRLDALQAAILSIKLRHLDAWNAARRRAAKAYVAALAGLPLMPVFIAPGADSSHHLAVFRTKARDALRQALSSAQIGTGVHYPIPCHLQAPFLCGQTPMLPVTETAAAEVLSLPLYPHMTETQIRQVADAIAQFFLTASAEPEFVGAV
ncbi:MAG: DegT/DnrJ/EryC1/StrS family aminotransferase [Acetobacteraceae bacterium]|nr:DegT/DnrJ/EryC1/StrS family aminotransferase [Acetobacteraceae bacterium]